MTALALLLALAAPGPKLSPARFTAQLETREAAQPGDGIIVGVVDRGRVRVYKAGTDGKGHPVNEHTLFEIGSITKTFTATMLAKLALEHRVSLTDPVQKYLPAGVRAPQRDGKQITLLNLAEQRSGLPRLPENFQAAVTDPENPYAHYSAQDLYAFLNSYKLPRDPGAKWEYSNLGFGLLGQALSNAYGAPYEAMLDALVLKPLGMNETAISLTPQEQARFAAAFTDGGSPISPWTFQAMAGAGAIRSDLADMLVYLRCNMGQGPMAKVCLDAQRPRAQMPGGRIGLAWWTNAGTHIVNHGGDTAGYHAMLAVSADRTRGVVVLSTGDEPVEQIAMHALDPAIAMPAYDVGKVDPRTLAAYAGVYQTTAPGVAFTVKDDGGRLVAKLTGQSYFQLYPAAHRRDRFYYHAVPASIDFLRAANGAIAGLTLHQGGRDLNASLNGAAVAAAQAQPSPSPAPPALKLDAAALDGYVGRYSGGPGLDFVVTRDGDRLMVKLDDQPSYPVFASAKDEFYYKVVDARISFKRNESGKVAALVLHQNGQALTAQKQ